MAELKPFMPLDILKTDIRAQEMGLDPLALAEVLAGHDAWSLFEGDELLACGGAAPDGEYHQVWIALTDAGKARRLTVARHVLRGFYRFGMHAKALVAYVNIDRPPEAFGLASWLRFDADLDHVVTIDGSDAQFFRYRLEPSHVG